MTVAPRNMAACVVCPRTLASCAPILVLLVLAALGSLSPAAQAHAEEVLLVGGVFSSAGGVPVRNLAAFNGSGWEALAAPVGPGTVRTLGRDGTGDLVVGGTFPTAGTAADVVNSLARYDGEGWAAIGEGVTDDFQPIADVETQIVYRGELYVGGDFTDAGDVPAANIAAWNGTAWRALGVGLTGFPFAFCEYNGDLYVGGDFITAGPVFSPDLARWDGTTWYNVATGIANVTSAVYALAVFDGALIIGGVFSAASGVPAEGIVRWDGTSYSTLGSGLGMERGLPVYVYSLAVYGGGVVAGGRFTSAGGLDTDRIAFWDGRVWAALGAGLDNVVYALTVYSGRLVAGGAFERTGSGAPVNGLALWDGSTWSGLGFTDTYDVLREVKALLPFSLAESVQ